MKKILLFLTALMLVFSGYSQAILEEGFESGTFPPEGWTTNSGSEWEASTGVYNGNPHAGTYFAYSPDLSSGHNSYLISPQLDLNGNYILDFWYSITFPTYASSTTFTVEISTTGTSTDNFTVLHTVSFPSGYDYQHVEINLSQYNGQQVYIAFHADDSNGTGINLDDITVAPAPTCFPPTGIVASNITTTGATISWTELEGASSYLVQYKNGGSWDGASEATTSGSSVELSDLVSSSTYQVRVQSDCGEEYPSAWSTVYTFNTSCGAIDVSEEAWFENLESVTGSGLTPLSPCWGTPVMSTVQDYDWSTYTYITNHYPAYYLGYGESCHSGVNSIEFKGSPAYLLLPEFEQDVTDLRLIFWATATSVTTGNIKVGVVTNPNATENINFIELADAGAPGERGGANAGNGNPMGPFDFNGLNIEGDVDLSEARIALYYTSTSDYNSWNLDDFTVSLIPACQEPSGLANGNIMATSAQVTWTEIEGTTYDLVYYASNNPESQTVRENVTLTDGYYTIEPLNPSSQYTWTVRTDCGDGTYANAYTQLTIKTPGTPIELPYERTFEEGEDNPVTEFTFQENDGDNKWVIGTATYKAGEEEEEETTEGHSLYISNDNGVTNYYNTSSTSYAYAILNVSFEESMEYHLSFDYKTMGEILSTTVYDYLSVYLMDASAEVPTDAIPSGIALLSQQCNVSDWKHEDYVLEDVAGTSKKIVFFWKNDNSSGTNPPAAIDNIKIEGKACGTPTNLAVSNVTTSSATVSWTENGTSTDWTVYYKERGSTEDYLEATASGEATVDLTSLEPNTGYQCYVVSNCGSEDSEASAIFNFRTACDAISVAETPWTSDFEGSDADFLNCWVSASTGSRNGNTYPHIEHTASIAHNSSSALEVAFGDIVTALPEFTEDLSTLQLTFWAKTNNYNNNYDNSLELGYITDPYDASTFVVLDSIPKTTTTYTKIVRSFDDLADANLPEGSRIAFRFIPGSTNNLTSWYLDDMQVGLIPTCNAPVYNSVTYSGVTDASATIAFTDNDPGHNAWKIYYRPANSEGDYETVDASTTEGTLIENLQSNTTYTVYVKTVCDGVPGENQTDPVTFTTTTVPLQIPATVTFEDEEENTQWILLNGNQTNKWYIGTPTDTASDVNTTEGGAKGLYISNDNGASNTYSGIYTDYSRVYAYRDVFVPEGTTEINLSFDWKAVGYNTSTQFLRVYWIDPTVVTLTPGSNPPTVDGVNYDSKAQIGNYGPNATEHWLAGQSEWQHITMNINSAQFAGMGAQDKVYRLVFHWRNADVYGTTNPPAAVDNVVLETAECNAPSNLTVTDITENSATLSWSGSADEYIITVAQGSNVETYNQSETTLELSGLASSTAVLITLQSVCGNDSSVVVTSNFNTTCGLISVAETPWFEDFESVSGGGQQAFPACWIIPMKPNGPFVYCGHYPSCHSGRNSAEFKGQPAYIILPQFEQAITELRFSFWATATNTYYGNVKVGIVTNPDATTGINFIELANVGTPGERGPGSANDTHTDGWGNYMGPYDFDALNTEDIDLTNARIALYYTSSSSSESWNLDDFTVRLIPTCKSPEKNSVTASNIQAHSMVISWTDTIEDHSSWTVYYKANGAEEWETEIVNDTMAVELTDLTPETPYQVYVITNCDVQDETPDATVTKTFTTGIACPAPTNVTVNASVNEAVVTWDGTADSYIVVCGEYPVTMEGNTATITGLAASSSYTVSITADCGEEDGMSTATTKNFMTACDVVTVYPYYESFENGLGCWTSEAVSGSYNWTASLSYSSVGSYSVFLNWNGNARLISPLFDMSALNNPTMSYDLFIRPWSGEYDKVEVFYRTDISEEWVSLATHEDNGDASEFGTYTVTLPNPSATYQVMFLGTGFDAYGMYLDNINIFDTTGGEVPCAVPTALNVGNVTESTANVTWTSEAAAWKLQYKQVSASDWGTEISVSTTPAYPLTGLSENTAYQVRVKAVCGEDNESAWTSAVNFTTNGGSTPTNPTVATNDVTDRTQTSAILHATITNPSDVEITAKGFEWRATSSGTFAPITGTGTGNEFTATLTGLQANTSYTYKAFITYAGGTTVYGSTVTFTTLPEDVQPCATPQNVTAVSHSKESIDVSWDANADVTAWNIQYRKQNTEQWATANTTENSYTIGGLIPETTYEIQVQAVCSSGSESDWSATVTATTLPDGLQEHLASQIVLYPNPAKEVVNVQCTMNNVQFEVTGIEVYDVYGKLINAVDVVENPTRINVSSLANGMYFVRVTTDAGAVTKTFVKK